MVLAHQSRTHRINRNPLQLDAFTTRGSTAGALAPLPLALAGNNVLYGSLSDDHGWTTFEGGAGRNVASMYSVATNARASVALQGVSFVRGFVG